VQNYPLEELTSEAVQAFLAANEGMDERNLVLHSQGVMGISPGIIADQISGRRKSKLKLPLLYTTAGIIFPPAANLEQSSSQKTAEFKANKFLVDIGDRALLLDLTGGAGVDSFFFSQQFGRIVYVEPDSRLFGIARHNHEKLGAGNIDHLNTTAEDFLSGWTGRASLVFVDPSRRGEARQKVTVFKDCKPDITSIQDDIFAISDYMLVKASPLLDIKAALSELKFVKRVVVLSVDNDCKELLFFSDSNFRGEPGILTVNLAGDAEQIFEFSMSEEKNAEASFSAPGTFIYEPNASVMKAGGFKIIGKQFGVEKLDRNTHLYTSKKMLGDFPGRIFQLDSLIASDPKDAARVFPEGKANVIVRNYPLSTTELKKKLKISDGGEKYLMGCSAYGKKILMALTRLK
jgi:hypothetical protein